MTEDGYFRFLIHEDNRTGVDRVDRIYYITYNVTGQLVFQHALTDFVTWSLEDDNRIWNAIFTDTGDVVFQTVSSNSGSITSIVDQAGVIQSERLLEGQLIQVRDGRILLHFYPYFQTNTLLSAWFYNIEKI